MSRTVYTLNRNWLYGGRYRAGATGSDCDDKSWQRVTIPHANIRLPWHSFDDKDYQFVSVYRRWFEPPRRHEGQRVFVDFGGVMAVAEVYLNGKRLGVHKGGYTDFSFELTKHLQWGRKNLLAVKVDSRERPDVPPFGGRIDYLTFGGIYRDVQLRCVAPTFIANVFARPYDVLDQRRRRLEVRCFLDNADADAGDYQLEAVLLDGKQTVAAARQAPAGPRSDIMLDDLGGVELWDIDRPRLYDVRVRLLQGRRVVDEYATRIGFREAQFTPKGFFLNGRHVKLRGLNRHQTYPYVGQAMPARVQRRDADILKRELKCNIVRTSHYPQAPAFLDRCDELGLLVFEEIPGWQHIGDMAWQDLSGVHVGEMIRRDWNHPSIILWGVRINESPDNDEFYTRTNAIARELDDSRQTGGVRCFFESKRLEDVFTMNDFNPDYLRPPEHPLYLNTEFCGHMFSTKHQDNVERVTEHVLRHARVHNMLGADERFAGGIGWCAFDYNTHYEFGSGDRICYHGVSDIFRIPKRAAGFYKSQCDPAEEVVLEPAFYWSLGDRSGGGGVGTAVVCSNCDTLKFYLGEKLAAEEKPNRELFPNLPHPPFTCAKLGGEWGDVWHNLRIEGYLRGKRVIERRFSSAGVDRRLDVILDDHTLVGDGIDATRLAFRVTDEYGNLRPFASGVVTIGIEGPGEIIGENPFGLAGGCGAVWVRTTEGAGTIKLSVSHPVLGAQTHKITVRKAPAESC